MKPAFVFIADVFIVIPIRLHFVNCNLIGWFVVSYTLQISGRNSALSGLAAGIYVWFITNSKSTLSINDQLFHRLLTV